MDEDRVGRVWAWLNDFPVSPHPDLGHGGVVCPFTVRALRMDMISLFPFDANQGDAVLIDYARQLRDDFVRRAEECNDRTYLVYLIVPYGLDETELRGMVERAHNTYRPEWVRLGLMMGDFWPDHETPGLHSETFRPFASPVPMLGMRHMIAGDLPFFVGPETPPRQRIENIQLFRRMFAERSGGPWPQRFDEAEAAARRELESTAAPR